MKIFSEKNTELKDFEEIILDIEKERDILDKCRASIRSCPWNLENPKKDRYCTLKTLSFDAKYQMMRNKFYEELGKDTKKAEIL